MVCVSLQFGLGCYGYTTDTTAAFLGSIALLGFLWRLSLKRSPFVFMFFRVLQLGFSFEMECTAPICAWIPNFSYY